MDSTVEIFRIFVNFFSLSVIGHILDKRYDRKYTSLREEIVVDLDILGIDQMNQVRNTL